MRICCVVWEASSLVQRQHTVSSLWGCASNVCVFSFYMKTHLFLSQMVTGPLLWEADLHMVMDRSSWYELSIRSGGFLSGPDSEVCSYSRGFFRHCEAHTCMSIAHLWKCLAVSCVLEVDWRKSIGSRGDLPLDPWGILHVWRCLPSFHMSSWNVQTPGSIPTLCDLPCD